MENANKQEWRCQTTTGIWYPWRDYYRSARVEKSLARFKGRMERRESWVVGGDRCNKKEGSSGMATRKRWSALVARTGVEIYRRRYELCRGNVTVCPGVIASKEFRAGGKVYRLVKSNLPDSSFNSLCGRAHVPARGIYINR